MINLADYQDIDNDVLVICTSGRRFVGEIISVDDEEESGLGEDGITLATRYGNYIGIGQSEIERIQVL